MSRRKWIFIGIGLMVMMWVGIFVGGAYFAHHLNSQSIDTVNPAEITSNPVLPVLWKAPKFSFIDQDGRPFKSSQLLGHVWVADFFFTQCTTACPIMTARLMMLERQNHDLSVRFVSFSVDPVHDTPAALLAYRKLWHGDAKRWILLSTTPTTLANVSRGMKVGVSKGTTAANPIQHSSVFLLVDKDGNVRGVYDSVDTDALHKLEHDVQQLSGGPQQAGQSDSFAMDTSGSAAQRGKELYGEMGCLACHSRSRVAPSLVGVAGSHVTLSDKTTVLADDAYLRESIESPGSQIVDGYLPTMPPYGPAMTPGKVSDLVAYLHTIGSDSPAGRAELLRASNHPAPAIGLTRDVVCKMMVRADPAGPHTVYDGKTYYFCSDKCLNKFCDDPSKYATVSTASEDSKSAITKSAVVVTP